MTETFLPHELNKKISDKISEQTIHSGLYIVSTPIGNIFDITFRAIFILNNSEDTRVAQKLLSFYEIKKKIISCNNYTELKDEIKKEIQKNANGIFSLISDAGTPLISDPGYRLAKWCLENSIKIFPVPGPCSAVAGLSVSGLPTDNFYFYGFLPNKQNQRTKELTHLKNILAPIIFLESPNRLITSLEKCLEIFGDRNCFVGRELTKFFEEHKYGKISEIIEYYKLHSPVGEVVFIVDKNHDPIRKNDNLEILLKTALESLPLKEAVAKIQNDTGERKKIIYDLALKIKKSDSV